MTTAAAERRGPLLRELDFRSFWMGETVSALGTSVGRTALPLTAVVQLHAGAFAVSALTAVSWLPWLLLGLPAGAWVDGRTRRPLMIACDAVALVALASVPVAAWLGLLRLPQLLLVALVVGCCSVVFQTAYQVFLVGLVPEDRMTEANALLQGGESTTQIAGPGVAGVLTQVLGAATGLLLDALSYLVSLVLLLRIRRPEMAPARGPGTATARHRIGAGLRFLAHDPYLRVLASYGALSNLALTGYQSVLVLFLVRDVGLSAGAVGAVLSAMSVGGLMGAAVAGRLARALGSCRAMLLANLAAGPFAMLIPLTAGGVRVGLVVLAGIGVGAAIVAGNVLKGAFRQSYVPTALLGRVVVGMQLLNYGTIPLGALAAGALASGLGLRPALWVMVVAFALAPLSLLVGPMRGDRDFREYASRGAPARAVTLAGPPTR